MPDSRKRPILVTGASGQLGGYLLRELAERDERAIAWSGSRAGRLFGQRLQPLDLADRDLVAAAFRAARPAAVIHAAAASRVDVCHRDPARARQVNTQGAQLLAELSSECGAELLLVSTDLVFDGQKGWYREEDSPSPLSVYGRTKAAAEPAVLDYQRGAVARVSLLFGPSLSGRPTFFDNTLAALQSGNPCTLFEDEWRTPLSLQTAAQSLLDIAASSCRGLLHVGGPERMSRLEMGRRLARSLSLDDRAIAVASQADFPAPEPRPRDTSLDSSRWRARFPHQPWPRWEEAVRELFP